jgi:ApaG protein
MAAMKSVTTIQKTAQQPPETPARMPDYEARKRNIPVNSLIEVTVKPEPYFLPRHSAPLDELFTFGYDVTFRNTGKEPVWLENRNWLITNGHEKQFDVFGPTVAGRQSIELVPNRKTPFVYKTAVPINTPTGKMKGYFSGSAAPNGAGAAFVTNEVEFNLYASLEAVGKCLRNRANAGFVDYADDDDLKTLQDLLRGYDKAREIDTRNLSLNNLATLWEFDRLLLKQFLIGYDERSISLHHIDPSFPARMGVWDMAFLAVGGRAGIEILKHERELKAGAKPSVGYNVVRADFRKKAIVDQSNATVENRGETSHSQRVLGPPKTGDAPSTKRVTLCVEERELEALEKVASGDASPAACAVVKGMVARARMAAAETTRPAPVASDAPIDMQGLVEQTAAPIEVSFAVALRCLALNERCKVLDKHYEGRKSWDDWKKEKRAGTPEDFGDWLNSWAGTREDRLTLGLLLGDLKRLDFHGYEKLKAMRKAKSGVSRATIESYGVSAKIPRAATVQSEKKEIGPLRPRQPFVFAQDILRLASRGGLDLGKLESACAAALRHADLL